MNPGMMPGMGMMGMPMMVDPGSMQAKKIEQARFQAVAERKATNKDAEKVTTVFVGGLRKTTTEDKVAGHFAKYGQVDSVDIKRLPDGSSRGFAFVKFTDKESVSKTIEAKASHMIDNKWVAVRPHGGSAYAAAQHMERARDVAQRQQEGREAVSKFYQDKTEKEGPESQDDYEEKWSEKYLQQAASLQDEKEGEEKDEKDAAMNPMMAMMMNPMMAMMMNPMMMNPMMMGGARPMMMPGCGGCGGCGCGGCGCGGGMGQTEPGESDPAASSTSPAEGASSSGPSAPSGPGMPCCGGCMPGCCGCSGCMPGCCGCPCGGCCGCPCGGCCGCPCGGCCGGCCGMPGGCMPGMPSLPNASAPEASEKPEGTPAGDSEGSGPVKEGSDNRYQPY